MRFLPSALHTFNEIGHSERRNAIFLDNMGFSYAPSEADGILVSISSHKAQSRQQADFAHNLRWISIEAYVYHMHVSQCPYPRLFSHKISSERARFLHNVESGTYGGRKADMEVKQV